MTGQFDEWRALKLRYVRLLEQMKKGYLDEAGKWHKKDGELLVGLPRGVNTMKQLQDKIDEITSQLETRNAQINNQPKAMK